MDNPTGPKFVNKILFFLCLLICEFVIFIICSGEPIVTFLELADLKTIWLKNIECASSEVGTHGTMEGN